MPDFPEPFEAVWRAYSDLAETRPTQIIAGPTGAIPVPAPISWSEIAAYDCETAASLSIAEKFLIRRLDRQFIQIATGTEPVKPKLGSFLRQRIAADRVGAGES